MKKSSTSLSDRLGRFATQGDSPEQFGVVLIKSILRSALEYKITSEDGKSLVVPILITVRPLRRDPAIESETATQKAPASKIELLDCRVECWKVLGHEVYCRTVCFSEHPTFGPPASASDESLLAQIKPGPPLLNPEPVEQSLRALILTAATSADVGVLASNGVASAVRAHPELIREDGSVELTAHATVSLPELGTDKPSGEQCKESCVIILGRPILCHEVCIVHIQ